jgi:anti-sigma factor RsiW
VSDHLGERLAALVDGALDHEAREQALAHLMTCPPCQADVAAHRALKLRLRGLPYPGLPAGLEGRLLGIAQLPGSGSTPGSSPVAWAPQNARFSRPDLGRTDSVRPVDARPAGRRTARRSRRRGRLGSRLVTGSAVLALGVTCVFLVRGTQQDSPAVQPQLTTYTVDHASTAGGVPGTDPATEAVVAVSTGR